MIGKAVLADADAAARASGCSSRSSTPSSRCPTCWTSSGCGSRWSPERELAIGAAWGGVNRSEPRWRVRRIARPTGGRPDPRLGSVKAPWCSGSTPGFRPGSARSIRVGAMASALSSPLRATAVARPHAAGSTQPDHPPDLRDDVALAFVAAGALLARRLREWGKPTDWTYELILFALVGGLVGARLDFIIENYDSVKDDLLATSSPAGGWPGTEAQSAAQSASGFGRGGGACSMSPCSTSAPRRWRSATRSGGSAARYSATATTARLGTAPAMAYPEGTEPIDETVHPTPIYETLSMGLIAYLLWRLRDRFRAGVLFAIYFVLAGPRAPAGRSSAATTSRDRPHPGPAPEPGDDRRPGRSAAREGAAAARSPGRPPRPEPRSDPCVSATPLRSARSRRWSSRPAPRRRLRGPREGGRLRRGRRRSRRRA